MVKYVSEYRQTLFSGPHIDVLVVSAFLIFVLGVLRVNLLLFTTFVLLIFWY
jgi:hypothetical protein